MNKCPECSNEMVERQLFTSLYYECEFCAERIKFQDEIDKKWPKDTNSAVNHDLGEISMSDLFDIYSDGEGW